MTEPIDLHHAPVTAPRGTVRRVELRVPARVRCGMSTALLGAGCTVRLVREDAASLVASGQATYEETST